MANYWTKTRVTPETILELAWINYWRCDLAKIRKSCWNKNFIKKLSLRLVNGSGDLKCKKWNGKA